MEPEAQAEAERKADVDNDVEMKDEEEVGEEGPKVSLPWAFIDCEIDSLIELVAHMLNKLLEHNDQVVLTPSALTRFHSRAPPGISVLDYLKRIVKYTNLEKLPLLSLLAYIDITCTNLPTFTLSSLTVHRFVISGITAGSKALCDVFCTNVHYAKVGGIRVGELNALEREFLRVTDWDLCVPAELIQQYYSSLIRSHGGFVQSSPPEKSPFTVFPLEGPVKNRPAKRDSGDENRASGSGSSSGKNDADEDGGEGMEVDMVKDEIRVRSGETGKTEKEVESVLKEVLRADPSSISSTRREGLLKTLLADLDEGEDGERAFSTTWSHDTWETAMETIKTLSRSTTGKTELTTLTALRILLRHAGIPLDSTSSLSASKTGSPTPLPLPPLQDIPLKVRKEALSTIANTLFLHSSTALSSLSTIGAGRAVVKQLRIEQEQTGAIDDTLLFLFGRILMWTTASKDSGFLQDLVDEQGLVAAIKTELARPYSANRKMATEELLKTTYNIFALYPVSSESQWESLFGSLPEPVTNLFISIPSSQLLPPLTHCINCLTRFPRLSLSILPKLYPILETHFIHRIGPWEPGEPVPTGERGKEVEKVEEVVTPSMLVLAKLAEKFKTEVRELLFPDDLDRSPGSKPLESRPTLLGHLIRFSKSPSHPNLSTAIGEVFWSACGGNANELVREIGYGNAAGLLFTKGISGPPGASVQEVQDDDDDGIKGKEEGKTGRTTKLGALRHPITGLEQVDERSVGSGKGVATTATVPASVSVTPSNSNPSASALASTSTAISSSTAGPDPNRPMTDEEKEVEAERLMTLFQRMERNPAMSMVNSGDARTPVNPMREMVGSGRMQAFEREEAERERKRVELEDREDEEEAMRELEQYKKRVKRV